MTESLRSCRTAAPSLEEHHLTEFLPGDRVYIDMRADHEYRGHSAVFVGYTDVDAGETQRWARLAIAEVLVEVRAEALRFAPESLVEKTRRE